MRLSVFEFGIIRLVNFEHCELVSQVLEYSSLRNRQKLVLILVLYPQHILYYAETLTARH